MTDDRPARDFEQSYRDGSTPWDLGRPQREVVALAEEGEFVGDVLDLGCGTGENALYLASLGRRVLGIDAAPSAIERAREKAAARASPVSFLVADALDLAKLHRRFETALDCGLFHAFAPEARRPYAHSLCEVLSPGGTLHLLCFSDEEPPGPGPRRVAQHELGDAFRAIFTLTRIRPGRFETRLHPDGARAWVATLVRIDSRPAGRGGPPATYFHGTRSRRSPAFAPRSRRAAAEIRKPSAARRTGQRTARKRSGPSRGSTATRASAPSPASGAGESRPARRARTSVTSSRRASQCGPPSNGSIRDTARKPIAARSRRTGSVSGPTSPRWRRTPGGEERRVDVGRREELLDELLVLRGRAGRRRGSRAR